MKVSEAGKDALGVGVGGAWGVLGYYWLSVFVFFALGWASERHVRKRQGVRQGK